MIFYFSGTGNTRWAAQRLAQATGERLLFIPDALQTDTPYILATDERIGFCFPVHGWQPPHIVREFVRRLTVTNAEGHYTYALCTCGDSTGLAMTMMRQAMAARGLTLDSSFSLTMPESYVCLPFMYTDTPERETEKIAQAEQDLGRFADAIINRQRGVNQLTIGPTPWLLTHVVGAYFNRHMISDRKFRVDADRCTHCGRCARECPVGDISLVDDLPEWKNDSSCTCCLSCYHHCPVHAINYGRITRRRGQYYFGHR